jgi:hypothetical protein
MQFEGEAETVMNITTRPILFSGEMVRAILAGSKTQTRRIMKPQPDSEPTAVESVALTKTNRNGIASPGKEVFGAYGDDWFCKCPYGAPVDRLWVRETWAVVPRVTDDGTKHKAKGDGTGATWRADWNGNPSGFKWKPSIHMPRWASRITLEITDIGVERLNQISEADAEAEGYPGTEVEGKHVPWSRTGWFESLWESINGLGSWEKNPWVWVVTFEVVEGEK